MSFKRANTAIWRRWLTLKYLFRRLSLRKTWSAVHNSFYIFRTHSILILISICTLCSYWHRSCIRYCYLLVCELDVVIFILLWQFILLFCCLIIILKSVSNNWFLSITLGYFVVSPVIIKCMELSLEIRKFTYSMSMIHIIMRSFLLWNWWLLLKSLRSGLLWIVSYCSFILVTYGMGIQKHIVVLNLNLFILVNWLLYIRVACDRLTLRIDWYLLFMRL